jgi:hypothetical protein
MCKQQIEIQYLKVKEMATVNRLIGVKCMFTRKQQKEKFRFFFFGAHLKILSESNSSTHLKGQKGTSSKNISKPTKTLGL